MKISKPDMSNVWAEGGSVAVVPSEKISQGWVVEIPPCEQMNFVQNRQDAGIAYMLQQGIPEWDSSTEYQAATSYIQFDSVVYKAIGTNTNKPPTTFPEFWEKAFDNAGSAQTVQDQINAIEADPDPFGQYLLETDAAKYGVKAELTNISSTNLNVIPDGVYHYDSTCTNRPFDSGKIVQSTVGTVKYQYSESLTQGIATRTSTSGVFTGWLYAVTNVAPSNYAALQDQINLLVAGQAALTESQKIKVYGLFFTTIDFLSSSEVTTHLGYGGWERYGEGKVLASRSAQPSTPAWTQTMNNVYGEYSHTLTVDEIPSHRHNVQGAARGANTVAWSNLSSDGIPNGGSNQSDYTGGGSPHNNVQPSIVIGVWRRVG